MKETLINLSKPLFVWLCIAIVWGVFRLFDFSEIFSELIAKPIIWLGINAAFLWWQFIPKEVLSDLKKNYLQRRPIWSVFVLPVVFSCVYFFLINFRSVSVPQFSLFILLLTIIINFTTAAVEEVVYRGVLYVWLMQKTNELTAFLIVQLLFLGIHLPILFFSFESWPVALTRVFFIVFLGAIDTFFFRFTKSIYASTLSHGTWNTLVQYFLLLR